MKGAPGYVCWLRSFPGAAWFSENDRTDPAVICKPIDEVAGLGKLTYAVVRLWGLLKNLPIPPG